jgi:hypothetical protein
MQFVLAAAPVTDGSTPLGPLAALLALAPSLLGGAKALLEFLRTRAEPKARSEAQPEVGDGAKGSTTVAVIRLATRNEPLPTAETLRKYRTAGRVLMLFGVGYLLLGTAFLLGWMQLGLGAYLQFVSGAAIAVQGAALIAMGLTRLRVKLVPGQPHVTSEASLTMLGEHRTVVQRCLKAMLDSNAMGATGCFIEPSEGRTRVQGGNRGWPSRARGQQIRVDVCAEERGRQEVHITVSAYWPDVRVRAQNTDTLNRLVRRLLS